MIPRPWSSLLRWLFIGLLTADPLIILALVKTILLDF